MAVSIMQPVAQEAPRHGEVDDATSRNHPCAIGPISEGTIAAPISKTVARAAGAGSVSRLWANLDVELLDADAGAAPRREDLLSKPLQDLPKPLQDLLAHELAWSCQRQQLTLDPHYAHLAEPVLEVDHAEHLLQHDAGASEGVLSSRTRAVAGRPGAGLSRARVGFWSEGSVRVGTNPGSSFDGVSVRPLRWERTNPGSSCANSEDELRFVLS